MAPAETLILEEVQTLRKEVGELRTFLALIVPMISGRKSDKDHWMPLRDFLKQRSMSNDQIQAVFRQYDYLRKYRRTGEQKRGSVLINVTEYDKLFHS